MPNEILFSKALSDKQKLLYVMISSLCAEKGYCWAGNKYFAEKLGFSESWVSKSITDMHKKGYIRVGISKKNGNSRGIALEGQTYSTGVTDPYSTGVLHNNTSNNNTSKKHFVTQAELDERFGSNLEKLVEAWNTIPDKYNLPKTRKITDALKQNWKKITKSYTKDELNLGLQNYLGSIRSRTMEKDGQRYYEHRFTLSQFLDQKNGLQKFINS